ncbi:MAG: energy transducer TonB [Bacteroidales bacterium]|nr:energy transducer TonB [Bacteroidales bacterium]
MKKILLFAMALLLSTALFGQAPANNDTDTVYHFVESMPEYPGGQNALFSFLSYEISYPQDAREKGITGTVLIKFVVEEDGSVSNAEVKMPLYPSIDRESVRAIMAMPKWKPGTLDGKPVRCYFQIPITFSMSKKEIRDAQKRAKRESKTR